MTWPELLDLLRARKLAGVAYDSRRVRPGQAFFALKGQHADGTAFVAAAIERGAAAIVSEVPPPGTGRLQIPWVVVEDARLAMALGAAAFYGDLRSDMRLVGITGTIGKTTTAYLIASIFEAAGIRCGVLGTVAYRIGDEVRAASHTTPEAPDVEQLLRD